MKKILILFLTFIACFGLLFADGTEVKNNDLEGEATHSREVLPVKVPVLMYHHISDRISNDAIVSPRKFEADIAFLRYEGFNPVFISDLEAYLLGTAELPDKPIIITLDDGYASNYEYAFAVAKKYGVKMTISMIGWSVGRSNLMDNKTPIYPHFTWQQAREMKESGLIDIQNHTYDLHNHQGFSQVGNKASGYGILPYKNESEETYRERLIQDVTSMQKLINEHIGSDSKFFFYPYGAHNGQTESILKNLGFTSTLTTVKGVRTFATVEDLFAIPRLNVTQELSWYKLIDAIRDLNEVD